MSEPIKSYQDLIAWQKAYALGKVIYELAGTLPEAERFGLISSLRRMSVSIASHIANGYGRGVTSDYIWFLKQARGEIYQLDTQLLFARDFKYLTDQAYETVKSQLNESERVLAGLIRSLGG
ncbi:MAG: four helix bundle protein [Phycisphaerales bacterium]